MAKRKPRKPTPKPDVEGDDFDEFPDEVREQSEPRASKKAAEKKSAKKAASKKRVARKDPRDQEQKGEQRGEVSDKRAPRPARPTVNLDKRKLTKKQKGQLEEWRGNTKGKKLDSYFAGQVEQARKQFGHRAVMAATEAANLVIVIPCPSLAFEYLIAQDGFPLGLVLHLAGPPGSLKSSLLLEFIRWFRMAGGGGILMENETKYSPDLPKSILGYEDAEVGLILNRCVSVEDWQDKLTYWIDTQKKGLIGTKEEPGPGRTVPILFGVDSIMGKASYETQEKVAKEGHAERSFPVEAMKMTTYMKSVPQWIDEWPFALVLNNHLKIGKDDTGREVKRTAGGVGVNFQESWELEPSVVKSKIGSADWDGVQIRIRCRKNSMGPTHRQIETRMLWWEEENKETGEWEQITVWDWDWATIKMLSTLKSRPAARLKDAGFHLQTPKVSDVENTAWSSNLGMKAKDAKPWQEVGRMIREDDQLMETLRTCLSIKRRPLLDGDYLDQLESLRKDLP